VCAELDSAFTLEEVDVAEATTEFTDSEDGDAELAVVPSTAPSMELLSPADAESAVDGRDAT